MKTTVIVLAGICLITACSDNKKTAAAPAAAEPVTQAAVPAVFVAAAPDGTPTPIPQAKANLKPGDDVLITGLVMGVKMPFVPGRGIFILGDEATLTPCDAKGMDRCTTPWDACCDPVDLRSAGTATIQVMDADGQLLKRDVRGINDLKELSRVTVKGKVAEIATPQALIVTATAIHVGIR